MYSKHIKKSSSFDEQTGKISSYAEVDNENNQARHYNFKDGIISSMRLIDSNGKLLEVTKYTNEKPHPPVKVLTAPIINTTGRDVATMKLEPFKFEQVETDVSKIQGEKILRSDKSIERIKDIEGNKAKEYFIKHNKLNLIMESVDNDTSRELRFTDSGDELDNIREHSDDIEKTTYFKNGKVENVEVWDSKKDFYKACSYYPDGKLQSYEEDDMKAHKNLLTTNFNPDETIYSIEEYDEKGMLKDANMHRAIENIQDNTSSSDNAKKIENFKSHLKDVNWEKNYDPKNNTIFMKQKGLVDGTEYEIFSNGIVCEEGCWQKPLIIMASNEEIIKEFKTFSQAPANSTQTKS